MITPISLNRKHVSENDIRGSRRPVMDFKQFTNHYDASLPDRIRASNSRHKMVRPYPAPGDDDFCTANINNMYGKSFKSSFNITPSTDSVREIYRKEENNISIICSESKIEEVEELDEVNIHITDDAINKPNLLEEIEEDNNQEIKAIEEDVNNNNDDEDTNNNNNAITPTTTTNNITSTTNTAAAAAATTDITTSTINKRSENLNSTDNCSRESLKCISLTIRNSVSDNEFIQRMEKPTHRKVPLRVKEDCDHDYDRDDKQNYSNRTKCDTPKCRRSRENNAPGCVQRNEGQDDFLYSIPLYIVIMLTTLMFFTLIVSKILFSPLDIKNATFSTLH